MANKALVFSDLHIHKHKKSDDRLEDCLKVLEWCFDSAIVNDCKYIFFLGDLFHDRSIIDVMTYFKTVDVFLKYFQDQTPPFEMYLLVGNHDMYLKERWDIHSVKALSAIQNVSIIDRPTKFKLNNTVIDLVPHLENPIKVLTSLKDSSSLHKKVLMTHMSVDGAILNSTYGNTSDVIIEYDSEMVRVTPEVFDGWDLTLLGHYHIGQRVTENVEYVGSPLELTFGEAFQEKHIMLLDLDTLDRSYIVNEFSPKHKLISADDIENHNLNDCFVRIICDDIPATEFIDLKNKIKSNPTIRTLDFQPKKKKEEIEEKDSQILEEAKSIFDNETDMLEAYLALNPVPDDLDKDLALEIGKNICELSRQSLKNNE